jgi:hypothetical protein
MAQHEVVVGIDPGIKGCLVVLETVTGHLLDKTLMPSDVLDIYKFLYSVKNTFPSLIIACEKAQTLPQVQGAKSAFTTGRNFGQLEAAIRLLYVPAQYIPPVTWQAELHKGADGPGPKERSLSVAKNLWPWETFTFSEKQQKAQDGIVDAMLIAEFLRRRVK